MQRVSAKQKVIAVRVVNRHWFWQDISFET